jgi:acetyl-CoA acetyltransferase
MESFRFLTVLSKAILMMPPVDIVMVSGARTPMGRYCGAWRDFTAIELAEVADWHRHDRGKPAALNRAA